MAGYPPTPPPPGGPPGPPQGPYGPQDPYGGQPGYGYPQQYPPGPQQGYPQGPYGAPQQPYGPPGGGPPPGYGGPVPPYPPRQPPRRTGAIIGGIAVGLVLLLGVGGVVAWVLMRPPAAYAALPSCDDVVTGEVTDIAGLGNAEVDEQTIDEEDFSEEVPQDVSEVADCGAFRDESAGYSGDEYVAIGLSRYTSDTVDDGYETVREEVEDRRSGSGLDNRFDEVTPPEPVQVGDTGFQYIAEFNDEDGAYYGADGGSLSYVEFADRNMAVTLWYRAPDRVSDDEKRETSLEVAEEVVRTLPEVTEVEEST